MQYKLIVTCCCCVDGKLLAALGGSKVWTESGFGLPCPKLTTLDITCVVTCDITALLFSFDSDFCDGTYNIVFCITLPALVSK